MLERMALDIRNALDRVAASNGSAVIEPSLVPDTRTAGRGSSQTPSTSRESQTDTPEAPGEADGGPKKAEPTGPAEKTEPTTLVVDQTGAGPFTMIGEAIDAASPGDRITVRPGEYREGLIIDMPLEIVGDGEVDTVVVEAENSNAMLFRANIGRVANLTLRNKTDDWSCVDVAQGRLVLEDCDITSLGAGVTIHGGADPLILRNRIHGCGGSGVIVHDSGKGSIEDNDIFGNTLSEVTITGGSDPTLRRNRIHDGVQSGVHVYNNGNGTIEDNDIFSNAYAGVTIATGGDPKVRGNRIHDGKQGGVFVHTEGKGTIEDNDIFGSAFSGVEISEAGNPTVRGNRIHDGAADGVSVHQNGEGTIEDNDIFGNAHAGLRVREGGYPTVRQNRVNRNGYEAVWIYDGGGGKFQNNDLTDNERGAWDISSNSRANVTRARNRLT